MRNEIPQWVLIACRTWGSQKRRIWSGHDWHGNIDGYANSLIGRIREEREGTGQGQRQQFWPEVFYGDGLIVQRTLPGIAVAQHDALHVKYVWDSRFKLTMAQKAALLSMSERALFEVTGRAETWVHARLENSAQLQLIDSSQKNSVQTLKSTLKTTYASVQSDKAPELSFAALNRTKITIKRSA